jgi:rod shape-determining protein MreD
MAILLAIPILGLLIIFQSAILSQVHLLQGSIDFVLLVLVAWAVQERVKTAWHWAVIAGLLTSLVSAMPVWAILAGYLAATGTALLLRRVFWQRPLFAMIAATFIGTLIIHAISILTLRLMGTPLPLIESLNLVTLPSALLNLLLAIPVYAVFGDLASWLYPVEIEM